MQELHEATAAFLDLYDLKPAGADLSELGLLVEAYAHLPWENMTKYLVKHGLCEDRPRDDQSRHRLLVVDHQAELSRLRHPFEVVTDHARFGSGGTCFSLTNTLRRIVSDLGYRSYPVMADMRHGANIHCGLVVELAERRYLLDPGYLVAEPVPLVPGRTVQVTNPGHRLEYRAVPGGDEYELYTYNARGDETFRYRLRARPVSDGEFMHHWLASFEATGMNGLHLNMVTDGGRLSAHNLNLRIDTGHGKRNEKLRHDYVSQVSQHFGLDPALVRRAYEHWQTVTKRRP